MITEMVTQAQLAEWKTLYEQYRDSMQSSRISGEELDDWFRAHYHPESLEDPAFRDIVCANVSEHIDASVVPEIRVYLLDGDIYVGIDRSTGYFHVECENIPKAVPVWDALFLQRGLSEEDLQNFVITGQYLALQQSRGGKV